MISEKFLGGKFGDLPLNQISEYAISESDLSSVQIFIKQLFQSFDPTPAHRLLPKFMWAGMATTNYDLLVEVAYEQSARSLQALKSFIENGDKVNEQMRDSKSLMYLKLHGCITRIQNPECPLILTTDQYITHRAGRGRIFDHLKDWAYERTFLFIGQSLQDVDIRAILNELSTLHESRPRHYLVAPNKDPIESRFWETKRITAIDSTFTEFMAALDSEIAPTSRGLPAALSSSQHKISEKFAVHAASLSRNCLQFLENDVDYVQGILAIDAVDPKEFYRGYSTGWESIEQKLDVRRTLGDTIISDYILNDESSHNPSMEFILIKAHAGAGKSVLLRRMAWDAAKEYRALCLFLKQSGIINTAALDEIGELCKERIFLFVDDVADRLRELNALARAVKSSGLKITVIAAERLNEWNAIGANASTLVSAQHELNYLSKSETLRLIELLSQHGSLGTLEGKSAEEQWEAFHERAGRQLLVALHEATLGRPFEDIIEDEYRNIIPDEAQRLYLSVCVLNRLNVPVRAGVISRLHGIRPGDFKARFFHPLEHVVHTISDPVSRDFMYVARHPAIAEIVFDRILRNQEERFDVYLRVLKTLNIDYSSDRKAFRLMTRGRMLLDLFPNEELGLRILEAARTISKEDPSLLHQHGLFEMHRNNLHAASDLFARANRARPHDQTIQHSRSELLLRMADNSRTELEHNRLLREASSIAKAIRSTKPPEAHAYHTLVKIGLRRLEALLANNEEDKMAAEIAETVKNIEKELSEGMIEFPNESHLLSADAELANILHDSNRVIVSLRKAFDANPRAGFLASRLATQYEKLGKRGEAKIILEKALDANRNDKALHFRYAKYLMETSGSSGQIISYHLKRSFTPGDSNYTAQILYGRQLFIDGEVDLYSEVFKSLKRARVAIEIRDRIMYPLNEMFWGTITRLEASYAVLKRDGAGDTISAQRKDISDETWKMLAYGSNVQFRIGFNFHGPCAFEFQLQNRI